MGNERYEKGWGIFEKLTGADGVTELERIHALYPDLANLIISNGFADIYSRPGLNLRERELVTLSSLITQGATEQLPMHVNAALNIGLTPDEIMEIVLQSTVYAGFPKALSAFAVVMDVLEKRTTHSSGADV
ncbi:carboxymuconolactone decarboxylase family protein [Aneurinibacillus aneurinilyticus]|uniref:carboxymuconolactone decarboxylase family protein n=1 Tax=Aneurinibacillus aneurinilyticus TaxID=1391 RepID=UPI0023EF824A|nr:carboxymuconolactone decarboxylase family protein [Aneurinibacillus aneurinilyticus]